MFSKDTHVLVVDDSLNIRRIVVDGLQRLGFSKITTAEDGNEGLEKISFFKTTPQAIGLVLSDVNMPGISGLEFLKKVRGIPDLESLPFILVTTESEKGSVIEAAVSGVSSYVVKPFNLETLSKRISEAWRKHNPDSPA